MTLHRRLLQIVLTVCTLGLQSSCGDQRVFAEAHQVALRSTERYELRTVGGDEEGATIVAQAKHFSLSEIRRNAETGFAAVYFYQAEAGFVGTDYAELEVNAGSDGASPPKRITRVRLYFTIRE